MVTSSVSSPADAVNVALRLIGYRLRVGHLFDGSEAANQALDIYGETRDEVLRASNWTFAERNVSLGSPLKSAPAQGYIPPTVWTSAYPPLPWAYEYAWPSDALQIRSVKQSAIFLFNPLPLPNLFDEANDEVAGVVQRVVLCNIPNAIAVYTGRITDPTNWDVDFTELFTSTLAKRLLPVLGNLQASNLVERGESQARSDAGEGGA